MAVAIAMSGCSTTAPVSSSRIGDSNLDCNGIRTEMQINQLRIETLSAQSTNMFGAAFWTDDQAPKAAALDQRNKHLAGLAREKGCGP
jgi:hypothetical protein